MKNTAFKSYAAAVGLISMFSCAMTAADLSEKMAVPLAPLSSVEAAHTLATGWNLGNTFDAFGNGKMGLESETCWGMPKTTKDMISSIKKAGFSTIRIPVSWHNHVDSNNIIDEKWMARVKEVVDWSLDEGLYVIINIHHDNLTEKEAKSGLPGFCVSEDSTLIEKSLSYLTTIWSQVAEKFKNYDTRLVFEIINEPRRIGEPEEWFFANPPDAKKWNTYVTQYEQACLDVIRKTGSENAQRFIMCPEYVASPHYLDYYTLPKDSAKDKLLLSTHAYDPYQFCMDKGSNNKFTPQVEGSIDYLFNMLNQKYTSKGIGVVMGETSASDKKNLEDRVKWIKCYYSKASAAKVAVILWDNNVTVKTGGDINSGECHGYFNRGNLSWYFPEINAAIKKSYK
nr:beta(1,4)-glucan glucanohydrolase [uncultured bacterium]